MEDISPLAVVEEGVIIGQNVVIEPFAHIKKGVVLGDNVQIKSHARLEGDTHIGEGSVIWSYASIGSPPQDVKYKGEPSSVRIGKNTVIRESATINRASGEGNITRVGDDCLLMAYTHVGHNSVVGNGVVMANSATLGGHVQVHDKVNIGGCVVVHQNCRIGKFAMVGGFSRLVLDVPPYTLGTGPRYRFGGLNRIGLRRSGMSYDMIKTLFKCYQAIYQTDWSVKDALAWIEDHIEASPEVEYFVDFCRTTKRGLSGLDTRLLRGCRQQENEAVEV